MDAGVRLDPGDLVYDGSVPLTFDPNGQFRMRVGESSLGGESDGGNPLSHCRKDPCDDETSAPQETRVATQQQHAAQSYTNLPAPSPPELSVSSFTITLGSTWVFQSSMGPAIITGLPLSSPTPVSSFHVSPHVSTSSTISAYSSTPMHGSTLSSVSSPSISSPSTSLLASLSFHPSASSVTRSFGGPLSSSSPACRSSPICHTGLPGSSRSMSRAFLSTLLASSTSVAPYQKTIIPAIPAKVSTLDTHTRSWYLGVIFGTIAGIALLVFFISLIFCGCRRAIKRRRAQNTQVPWAPKAGDEEEGGGPRNLSSANSNASTSLKNSSCVQRWWLTADDRDVGESGGAAPGFTTTTNPNDSTYSLRNHPIPGHGLFSDEPLPTGSGRKPPVGHHLYPSTTLRQLPSHLIDDEIAARALQEDRSSYSPFAGSPVRLWQRSRSHVRDVENTTYNPYIDPSSESIQDRNQASHFSDQQTVGRRPLVDRIRNLGKQKAEYSGSWDRLPTPGKDQAREDIEPWAASFKASLVNAFHAFAASISSSSSEPLTSRKVGDDHHDGLTRAPTRRRMSTRDGLMKPLSHQTSDKRKMPSSKPWILREREDGSGTVHFLPGLEKYDHGEMERESPGKRAPLLSFGTGEKFSTYDDEKMGHPRRTAEQPRRSHCIPLATPPPKAITKPDVETGSISERNSRSANYSRSVYNKWTPVSRNSSVYSYSTWTSSTSTTKLGNVSRLPRVPSATAKHPGIRLGEDVDSVVLEPDRLSFDSYSTRSIRRRLL